MTKFQYRALTLAGREMVGEAEARHLKGLAHTLSERGLLLIEARSLVDKQDWIGSFFALSVRQGDVTRFLSDLALLLRTGQPIDEALRLLAHDMRGALGRIVRALHSDLLKGTTFVDALARHPQIFPAQLLALVQVSEVTGRLDEAVEVATAQRMKQAALADQMKAALRYPAFLLVAAMGVLFFFLIYVMPQFSAVLSDAGAKAGSAISILMAASSLLRENLYLLTVLAAATLLAGLVAARSSTFRNGLWDMFSSLPLIRGTLEQHRAAVFCLTLGALLGQGVSIPIALKVIEEIIGGQVGAALSTVGDLVRRGGNLGDALDASALLPEIASRMLKIGEESGELAEVALRAGALYEKKLQQRLDAITGFIGPAAVIVISSMIGGLMVTIMTAMISLNQLIS